MLACARIGAIHSVVFGGFAADELSVRIDDATPRWSSRRRAASRAARDRVQTAARPRHRAGGISRSLRHSAAPPSGGGVVAGRDLDWAERWPAPAGRCVPVEATDPLYILYTSGTTGRPKGVVRDNGGHAVALLWTMRECLRRRAGDVFWAASDVGWVVGHSYIVYGPLLAGCTTVLYEGKPVGTPDAGAFWRVIAEHGVNSVLHRADRDRAIRKEDPDGDHLAYDFPGSGRVPGGRAARPRDLPWARDCSASR